MLMSATHHGGTSPGCTMSCPLKMTRSSWELPYLQNGNNGPRRSLRKPTTNIVGRYYGTTQTNRVSWDYIIAEGGLVKNRTVEAASENVNAHAHTGNPGKDPGLHPEGVGRLDKRMILRHGMAAQLTTRIMRKSHGVIPPQGPDTRVRVLRGAPPRLQRGEMREMNIGRVMKGVTREDAPRIIRPLREGRQSESHRIHLLDVIQQEKLHHMFMEDGRRMRFLAKHRNLKQAGAMKLEARPARWDKSNAPSI